VSSPYRESGKYLTSTPGLRPLRGRALVEVLSEYTGLLVLPDLDPHAEREKKSHRGRVLALGPPAHAERSWDGDRWVGGAPVPWDCRVGDEVQFVFAVWLDKMRRGRDWPESMGGNAELAVIAQEEILGVWE